MKKQKISFADNELIESVTIPIYADGLNEGVESFELQVFNKLQDTSAISTSELFIKNVDQGNLTYNITSNADSNVVLLFMPCLIADSTAVLLLMPPLIADSITFLLLIVLLMPIQMWFCCLCRI